MTQFFALFLGILHYWHPKGGTQCTSPKSPLYGFHSQTGKSGNAKIAFVAALAKPKKCSVAFCI